MTAGLLYCHGSRTNAPWMLCAKAPMDALDARSSGRNTTFSTPSALSLAKASVADACHGMMIGVKCNMVFAARVCTFNHAS
jgi:hypothetical protein